MDVRLVLLFFSFLSFAACNSQEENDVPVIVSEDSVSLISLRVFDLIFTSTENRGLQFYDHIFFRSKQDLIFKNNQDTS